MQALQAHPMSERIFGHLLDDEFQDLKQDIQRRGLMHVIELDRHERVICGGERLRALRDLGVKSISVAIHDSLESEDDIEEHLILDNLRRRHLTPSQTYRAAVELERIEQARVKVGRPLGGAKKDPGTAEGKAAAKAGTTRTHLQRLKTIFESGNSKLQDAVDRGEVSVRAAASKIKGAPRQGAATKLQGDDPRTHALRWARLQTESSGLLKFLKLHPVADFGAYGDDVRQHLQGVQSDVAAYLEGES